MAVLTGWLLYGHLGVTVFIVLAGYSLTIAVLPRDGELRGGFFGFMFRRGRRILPPYWAALALTLALTVLLIRDETGTQWDLVVPTDWQGVLADLFLVQDLTGTQDISYTFWSIAVEWHIYLIFPLILLIWRLSNVWVGLTAGILIGAAGIIAARFFDPVNDLWPAFYLAFVLGMAARVMGSGPSPVWLRRLPWGTVGGVTLGALGVLLARHDYAWLVAHMKPVDLLAGFGVAAVLTSLTLGRAGWLNRALSVRWLVFVGGFSYSLYLVHAPLLQVGWKYLIAPLTRSDGTQVVLMLLVVAPLTVAVAWGFYWIFERPFMSAWRQRISSASSQRTALPSAP